MQGREVGTPGAEKARRYLVERFRDAGIAPFGASYARGFELSRPAGGVSRLQGVNVIGQVEGTKDPGRFIAVTAHYDHVGVRNTQVYNGANDNASGAAALIAIGRHFTRRRPAHSLLIAAFDGEERGLYGSQTFIKQPPVDLSALIVNVNLDMIGRDKDDRLYAAGSYHYPVLKPLLLRVAAAAPVKLLLGHDDPNQRGVEDWTRDSDHYVFHQAKIPFVYLGVEDFDQHHRATDDYETMTHDFYVRAVETAIAVIGELDANLETIAAGRGQTTDIETVTATGRLSGRLHMPEGATRAPVVVLIGVPATWREPLAAEGIATLTYEHRAPHAVADAVAWITRLRNDVRFSAVIAAGASTGVAGRAARAARADAVVSFPSVGAATGPAQSTVPALEVKEDLGQSAAANAMANWIRRLRLARHPATERRSPRDVVMAEIEGCQIAIEYGRPSKRGRAIWGALVPWDRWWMPGADESTALTTSGTLVFDGLTVPPGDYTLYTEPRRDSFTLMINQDAWQFHTIYRADRDLGRVGMKQAAAREPVELMTFALEARAGGGVLRLAWDDREYAAPFVVQK
jgi:hypothetical protein